MKKSLIKICSVIACLLVFVSSFAISSFAAGFNSPEVPTLTVGSTAPEGYYVYHGSFGIEQPFGFNSVAGSTPSGDEKPSFMWYQGQRLYLWFIGPDSEEQWPLFEYSVDFNEGENPYYLTTTLEIDGRGDAQLDYLFYFTNFYVSNEAFASYINNNFYYCGTQPLMDLSEQRGWYGEIYDIISVTFYGGASLTPEQNMIATLIATLFCVLCIALPLLIVLWLIKFICAWRL